MQRTTTVSMAASSWSSESGATGMGSGSMTVTSARPASAVGGTAASSAGGAAASGDRGGAPASGSTTALAVLVASRSQPSHAPTPAAKPPATTVRRDRGGFASSSAMIEIRLPIDREYN